MAGSAVRSRVSHTPFLSLSKGLFNLKEKEMHKKRILLVDGDPGIRDMLKDYLEKNGHEVETADDGLEALEKLKQFGYDSVVTNYNIPKVDGLEVLRQVKKDKPTLPVVMIADAGTGGELAARALSALGAQALLNKPFNVQDLESLVKRL
jgi:CheY-like chemotaxis protein